MKAYGKSVLADQLPKFDKQKKLMSHKHRVAGGYNSLLLQFAKDSFEHSSNLNTLALPPGSVSISVANATYE